MELNRELNLEECLNILNSMLYYKTESDSDGYEVVYINCSLKGVEDLLKIMLPYNDDYHEYLANFGFFYEQYLDESEVDLVGLWGEVGSKFNVDIWVDFIKNRFYVRKFHHKVLFEAKILRRKLKRKINNIKFKVKMHIYDIGEKRRTKTLIKAFGEAERRLKEKNK